jgi:hypothetical protein
MIVQKMIQESILLKLANENKKIIYIRHEVNQGVGAAMISGYKRSWN